MGFSDVMRKAFPFISIAASMGGPLGTMAANAVGKAIGVEKVPSTSEGIANVIAGAMMNPDQRIALQKAEEDFQLQMAALNVKSVEDLEQIAANDRASARNREIEVKDYTPRILAFTVVALCFTGEALYFFRGAPANAAPELIGRILGTLDSALMLVLAYYFGSSAGSDKKTQIMADAASAAAGKV